ncbi:MAG: hypothetical protein ABIO39_04030 [Caulobacteraceae bacterium]
MRLGRVRRWRYGAALGVAVAGVMSGLAFAGGAPDRWWAAGEGRALPAQVSYANPEGKLTLLNAAGRMETRGHPFFEPIGTNGRACVTCHQPADGMSISAATLRQRWAATKGRDPVFAAIDGSNCPSQPQGRRASHSLLLDKGLFRIFLPWPPKNAAGKAITPEFTIEVVKDPTGCNTDPVYGLKSADPMVSVYRRPRVVANVKYVTPPDRIAMPFEVKSGEPLGIDPDTGERVSMNMMADSREPTLKTQAISAALSHLQAKTRPSDEQLARIVEFERGLYVAQTRHVKAGNLVEPGGPKGLGPLAMQRETPGILANRANEFLFMSFEGWAGAKDVKPGSQAAFRASVARGAALFQTRTIWVKDVYNFNTLGVGNPQKRNCVGCHNSFMTGMDVAPGFMDLGIQNLPWSEGGDELPLFKLTCDKAARPHPYLGRVIYSHDPGRALATGRCAEIGAITMQQFRGLAARAPYFSNGEAATLRDVIEVYDRRFDMKLTEQEKQDLTNFMSVL